MITVSGTGATTVTYKHNAFGERVSHIEGSATTHFHYDQDGRLIAETDGTGALVREYLWLGDKPLALVVGPAASATLYFVHADHLERVEKITDAAQAIVWDGQFTPYGGTHAITGTIQNPLRFPGQWADPAASYFYNYLRDYDPTLARYLSVDPFTWAQSPNPYVYSFSNPQAFIDKFGAQTSTSLGGPTAPRQGLQSSIWGGNYQRLWGRIREISPNATEPRTVQFGLGNIDYTIDEAAERGDVASTHSRKRKRKVHWSNENKG